MTQNHQWVSKTGRPWSLRVKSDLCRDCKRTPDAHPSDIPEPPSHNEYCPEEFISHLADIEAGWTLGKPWKVSNEAEMEERNRTEIREMLDRWREHGYAVVSLVVPHIPDPTYADGQTDPWD